MLEKKKRIDSDSSPSKIQKLEEQHVEDKKKIEELEEENSELKQENYELKEKERVRAELDLPDEVSEVLLIYLFDLLDFFVLIS